MVGVGMPHKVNIKAWYNEQQVFTVWDCYVQGKKLKYFIGKNQRHTNLFNSGTMSIAHHTGFIINPEAWFVLLLSSFYRTH